MILINMVAANSQQLFVSDYTLPNGEKIVKDINDPDRIGYSPLIGFEGHYLTLTFPDGHSQKGKLVQATEDYIKVNWDVE